MTIVSDSSGLKAPVKLLTAQLEATETAAIQAELATIPPEASIGSIAYTKDGKHIYVKDEMGGWNDWLADGASA